jgi:hypothetical protein
MVSFYPRDSRNNRKRTTHPLVTGAFKVYFVVFVSFVVIAQFIGGDAVNGHAANGHYYLANHGKVTEVGQGVFIYSLCHVALTGISLLTFIVLTIWFRLFPGRRIRQDRV